ncbi:hypothetical protein Clacol_010166 [Clathrus columnatus]|uniref:Uncharacterized protein n=1 Tax=Clathrus columnatus TaxID=1419009 RepID=A0AAV5AQV1_9AGAM|nr:hypothetical protein Clacol_010166 [Clathrus columnatus]
MPPKPRLVILTPLQSVNAEQTKTSNPEQARKSNAGTSTSQAPPILDSELNTLKASYKDIIDATGKRYAIAVIQHKRNKLKTRLVAEASIHPPTICSTTTYASLASASEPAMLTDAPANVNVLPQLRGSTPPMPNPQQSVIPMRSSLHQPGFPSRMDIPPMNMNNPQAHVNAFTTPGNTTGNLGLTRAPDPVTLAPKAVNGRTLASDPTFNYNTFINPGHQTITEWSTVPIPDRSVIDSTSRSVLGTQLGDSADNPIELDMDTDSDHINMFGDPSTTVENHPSGIQTDPNPISMSCNFDTNSLSTHGANRITHTFTNPMYRTSPQDGRLPTWPVNYPSVGTVRPLEEHSRFDLTNIDLSALTGLFNTGNGGGIPQLSNAAIQNNFNLMSQLLGTYYGRGNNRQSY